MITYSASSGAVVVKGLVVGAQLLVDLVHVLDHHGGQLVVMGVAGLTGLEEDVGILGGTFNDGMVGIQSPGAETLHSLLIHHLPEVLIVPNADLLDLVGGPEAVEEIEERGRSVNGRQMGHRGKVHDLLGVGRCQHGQSRCPGRPLRRCGRRRWKGRGWPGRGRKRA